MATTDKELAERRSRVEKLREQVAAEEAKRVAREAEASNDVAAAQLDAEEARLVAQLQMAKQLSGATTVKESVATVVEPSVAEKHAAEAQAKAQKAATSKKKGA